MSGFFIFGQLPVRVLLSREAKSPDFGLILRTDYKPRYIKPSISSMRLVLLSGSDYLDRYFALTKE